jgi:hypothetical protein
MGAGASRLPRGPHSRSLARAPPRPTAVTGRQNPRLIRRDQKRMAEIEARLVGG